MTDINTKYVADKFNIKLMNQPIPYKKCILRDYDKSLDKVWHVEYYIFDQAAEKLVRRRVTLSHDTAKARYAEAKTIIKDIDKLLEYGAVINPIKKTEQKEIIATSSLTDACQYFINFQQSILRHRTFETYQTDIKRFTKYLEATAKTFQLQSFTEPDALTFLDYLISDSKISNRSRNNTKGTLSTMFNFYLKRKIIADNPFSAIAKLSSNYTRHTAFSDAQAKAFKEQCIYRGEHQLLLSVYFIYFTYLRPRSELRFLKVGDIKEKTILITAPNSKEGKQEHVMIPEEFEKILQQYKVRTFPESYYVFGDDDQPGPTPLGRDHMYNKHRKILERLNLTGKNLDHYAWKHTGAIALWRATQNVALISQQCRHTTVGVTLQYLRDLGQFIDFNQINKFPAF